ncbi:MAG: Tad domain-containing protein [Eubacterium sp.]|nr:Tad domain-containing protein [Eubacterium sp.]
MKKFKRLKKERGAITVMAALMLTVLLGFTALSIDIGLHHYLGAKLQSAVDSAATAVGSKIEVDETELESTAYEYLAKNGYDVNGKYKDSLTVKIDFKGYVDEDTFASTSEDENYLTAGYIKLTADVDDKTLFANALGISSMHLKKTAYVRVSPNYDGMPEALKYSIFAGARMGDYDEKNDDGTIKSYVDADHPAMDVQGSTGAGSGETAFSSVVAVAEGAINGINTFVQDLKGWMNSTFGTSFDQNYNTLVNINVSEAVMNNDSHSNSNILIGVQALNAARTKDNDYTGEAPQYNPANSTNSVTTESVVDEYNALTDADDYGSVHFTAVDDIKFGYSLYAQQRATNFIGAALENYLNNRPKLTRVYVQNMQSVQAIQHTINILNEMDLDDCTDGNFATKFENEAQAYFKVNNRVSQAIKNKVLAMKTDLVFNGNNNTIELNNQEAIVYRVNQKVAGEKLAEYAAIEVDLDSDIEKQRMSRLEQLTSELTAIGFDKLYKNNSSTQGFLYQNFADTDGGNIGADTVILERYEDAQHNHVEKTDKNATLKYTYKLTVNGKKVNRNMDNVEEYLTSGGFNLNDVKATRLGAKYALTRTFKEKSDYIDMPNLRPFFTRQINQSVRDATKKRGQFNDGTTTGDRNVKLAVKTAQNDLSELQEDVTYTDNTYSDVSQYDNNYAKNLLFTDFKSNADSGLTKLGSSEQPLGGVSMSNHSFKGYELYDSDGKLKKAIDFVNQYDDWNHGNDWYGHEAVNKFANEGNGGVGTTSWEQNAVANKKTEINNEYGDSGASNNKSYRAKKVDVAQEISNTSKPNIEDVTGTPGQLNSVSKVLATPTKPIPNDVFLGGGGAANLNVAANNALRTAFNTQIRTIDGVADPALISDSTLALPATGMDAELPSNSSNNDAKWDKTYPTAYTTATTTIPGAPTSSPSTSGMSNGGEISGNFKPSTNDTWTLPNNTYYSNIYNHKRKGTGWFASWTDTSCIVGSGNTNVVTGDISMTNGKSVDNNGTLKVGGNVSFTGGSSHLTFGGNSTTEVAGFIDINTTASVEERKVSDGATLKVGKYLRQVGNENALEVGKNSTLIVSGTQKYPVGAIDTGDPNFSCAVVTNGNIKVWDNATFKANGDVVSTSGSKSVELCSGATMVVNGHLKVRDNLTVASGATLYVSGDIMTWSKITNNGTIICGGKVFTKSQDVINNGTLIAGSISVGENETRWLYNNGTVKTTGDVWINGQLLNNDGKNNVTTVFVCGGNLTTKDAIYNNPGKNSGSNAYIRVDGNIDANSGGGVVYNNYSNNSSGSRAYIYIGKKSNTGTINNYTNAYIHAWGTPAANGGSASDYGINCSSIQNSADCYIVSNTSIYSGSITNNVSSSSNTVSWISAKTTLRGTSITNGGSMYAGTDFTATSDLDTHDHILRAGHDLILSGTVNATGAIFTAGNVVSGNADITCTDMYSKNGITAKSINLTRNVKTDGKIKVTYKVTVGTSGNLYSNTNDIEAGSIENKNTVVAYNNITTTNNEIKNLKDMFAIHGGVNTNGCNLINGTTDNRVAVLRVRKSISAGYTENYGQIYAGTVLNSGSPDEGNLTVNYVKSGEVYSVYNFGTLYTAGTITAKGQIGSNGGDIRVLGDIVACNDDNYVTLLDIKNVTKLYVRGCVTTNGEDNKRLWIDKDSGVDCGETVISILGNGSGSWDCFKNKLDCFHNDQPGSTIYLGTKLNVYGAGPDGDSWFLNSGRLYVFGEINCNYMKSIWLTGEYNYGKTLAEDYVSGTYDDNTPKYSGLTYCFDKFNAPNAALNIGGQHFLFVEDEFIDNYNQEETPTVNISVKSVSMWGDAMAYAPNEANVTESITVQGTAVFNVQNKVETSGIIGDGQVVAPVEVEIAGEANLSGLSNVVFDGDKSANRLTGTRVEVRVNGNLTINGPINLTNSRLIVTGNIICTSITLDRSKVHVGGTLTVNGGGAITMTNSSQMLIDSNIPVCGAIVLDNSTLFVTEGIANAISATLTNGAWLVSRDDNQNADDDNVVLSGATSVSGSSNMFVDGKLRTTSVTANDGSKVYGYNGVEYTTNTTINVDTTTHGVDNSVVFCGDNTSYGGLIGFESDGTLYLPPNKPIDNSSNTNYHITVLNHGVVVCDSSIKSTWVQVGSDSSANGVATLYCADRITLIGNDTRYSNYGKLYAYGGTDVGSAHKGGKNSPDFDLLYDNSETFFGEIYYNGSKLTTWNYGYYEGHGDTYIDCGLNVNNYTDASGKKVGNRGTALYIPNGTTYVSGNVTLCNDNAALVAEDAGIVCQKDFKIGCTIWNYGTMHIYGAFTMDNSATYITDNKNTTSKPYEGWSLKNGSDWDNGGSKASFLAYNYGNRGGLLTFKGYVKNSGSLKMNYGLSVEGYCTQEGSAKDFAFVNFAGANAQFSGEFRCNGNRFFNRWDTSFGCDGRLTYGEIAFNCGQMYVGGDLLNGYNSEFSIRTPTDYRDNAVGWLNIGGSDSRSFSFMNGAYKINGDTTSNPAQHTMPNATLFVGGNMQIGNYESEHKAGTVLNVGTMYTRGYLKVYSYGGDEGINTGPSFYQTSLMLTNESNTFVGGECYSGSAAVTGKNSIFMVDGDLRVRRPLKVNMWLRFYDSGGTAGNVLSYFEDGQYKGKGWLGSNDDGYRACYMRVGGNVYANVEGRDLENWAATSFAGDVVPYDHSRDIDIQANANIFIGGSFYCPQKLYLKQNCKLVICGQGDSLYDSNGNLNWKCRALDELSDQKNNPLAFGPDITAVLKGNIQNLENRLTGERCALFAYMLLDMNICSSLVVHGNAFVRDTCKIRDMTKTYIYGDMIAKDYLEVGKSLADDQEDATQARLDKYKNTGENDTDYVFRNAGYMYVGGDLTSRKYTKIYASTTVKVGGDMQAGDWTQLLGNPYITLRHDARVYVGGNMRAYSSIDCGAYSEMYVNGNVTAYTQNIKLRDQMTCYVGGDMAAASYIELGKYDDNFYRGVKGMTRQQAEAYLDEIEHQHQEQLVNETGDVTDGGEFAYNGDEHERTNSENSSDAGNDNDTETESSASGDVNAVNDSTELENDDSDLAIGSEYYIGGNLISFTKYIREYAYSRAVTGGYVVATQHVTLRHNSDLWVLPEVFGKSTYHTTVYVPQEGWDTNLWTRLQNSFNKMFHDISEAVEPKAGSIYSMGQLTMNKNTSIFGTYDTMVFGQTVLRKGSLIYMGHDFDCWAPIYNLQSDFSSFDAFMDSMKANLGLSSSKTYKGFDSYDETQRDTYSKPIVIYANRNINVATTAKIRFTYFIANRGDVNFTNMNFASETSDVTRMDAKELPNAFASYKGDVNYYSLRGTLGALMYAPQGNVDLDGFAYDFYGSIMGHTVDINTFYINVHRFNNWRTMDLHIATSQKVYLISEEEYKNAQDNVDDMYMYGYDTNPDPTINEWAQPFFPGLPKDDTSSSESGGDYDDGFNTENSGSGGA